MCGVPKTALPVAAGEVLAAGAVAPLVALVELAALVELVELVELAGLVAEVVELLEHGDCAPRYEAYGRELRECR